MARQACRRIPGEHRSEGVLEMAHAKTLIAVLQEQIQGRSWRVALGAPFGGNGSSTVHVGPEIRR